MLAPNDTTGEEKHGLLDVGFPPTITSVLAETIPSGLPTNGLCRWDVKAPWRPFTPQAGGTTCIPWYLRGDIPSSSQQDLIRREIQALESAIYELCQRCSQYKGPKPTPSAVSFDSVEHFRQASLGMLDLVGFVKWWMAWYPESTSIDTNTLSLPRIALQTLSTYVALSLAQSAVVLDLCEDWHTANLPLWISENILVYYKWTSSEAADARFDDFSPTRSSVLVSLECPIQFLHHPEDGPPPKKNVPNKDCFAVDFYLWQRRKIQPAFVRKYTKSRIPFEVFDVSGNGSWNKVFHLWKLPESGGVDDSDHSDDDDTGLLESPQARRELYRFHCAPHSGRQYDRKTGIAIQTALNTSARFLSEPGGQESEKSRGAGTQTMLPPRTPTDRYLSQQGHTSRTSDRRFSSSSSSRDRSTSSRHASSSYGYTSSLINSSYLGRQSTLPGTRENWGSTSGHASSPQSYMPPSRNSYLGRQSTPPGTRENWGSRPSNSGGRSVSHQDPWSRDSTNPPSSQLTPHWDSGKHGFGAREPPHPNHPSSGFPPPLGTRLLAGTTSQPQQDISPETTSSKTDADAPKARLTFPQYLARKKVRVYDYIYRCNCLM